ncbi:haloacid dehalogenase [Trinickia dabaoshanensis]|uniref:Haloacid dehalogenase n=1 Tax=Trinickia dabaoshanensis TaxID=564714 RepID=A0A2N7VX60_9BURK|nr:HAD family hydrolase [Trinickia dabaoshanensis]PMS21728.1 haloacid dehalogenase [Trinickia dabaoshanensis]
MRFVALATDYDNTIATDGRVSDDTWSALERLRQSGRHLILVSGRELEDLRSICPRLDLFSRVVAENGGVLYRPDRGEKRLLAPAPPQAFVDALRKHGMHRFSVSETLVATMKPNEQIALEAIRDLGLDLHVVFNGDAVMILAPGVTKATGLRAALDELDLSPLNVAGVGDAENDHPLLEACGFSVAVANALPALKAHADWVTPSESGRGVSELANALVEDDLSSRTAALDRCKLLLGHRRTRRGDEAPFLLDAHGTIALLAGPSGGGKSTVTAALLERLRHAGYQACIFDPEGDYGHEGDLVALGDAHTMPTLDSAVQLLGNAKQSVAVNLLRVPLIERPRFCASLLLRLQALRVQTGRPHWLVFEEAHQLFPADWNPADESLPAMLETALAVTVHPDQVAPALLRQVDTALVTGAHPDKTIAAFGEALGCRPPALDGIDSLERGQLLVWRPKDASRADGTNAIEVVTVEPGTTQRRRHHRKYAEGLLIPERSFYFRGPDGRLNLRAHNLVLFLEIADGVDPETWQFHLRRGDYSQWFGEVIGDEELASEAHSIEREDALDAAGSRAKIREAVERRYTQPDNPSLPPLRQS